MSIRVVRKIVGAEELLATAKAELPGAMFAAADPAKDPTHRAQNLEMVELIAEIIAVCSHDQKGN